MTETYAPDFRQPLIIGAKGIEAVRQNIRIIILTFCCSIPLDRDFAHKARPLDSPGPLDTARLTGEIIDAIEQYEKRVTVKALEWETSAADAESGVFRPKITFSLKKGVEL